MGSNSSFLQVENLTVKFSRWGQAVTALDSITLSMPQGQWLIVVGHNGSGKSTLLKAISGQIEVDAGEVLIEGRRVGAMRGGELAGKLFYVHQDPLLGTAPILTVYENLVVADYYAQLEREAKHLLLLKYKEMLEPLGLSERMKQPVRTLSGGERQLLALLIARLRPASLVLLDEPFAALDPAKVKLCMLEIVRLNKAGKTLIQVTHDERLAFSLGDRTVGLKGGRIVYDEAGTVRSQMVPHEL
jgi:putative ABC transport system ATP-binding protein